MANVLKSEDHNNCEYPSVVHENSTIISTLKNLTSYEFYLFLYWNSISCWSMVIKTISGSLIIESSWCAAYNCRLKSHSFISNSTKIIRIWDYLLPLFLLLLSIQISWIVEYLIFHSSSIEFTLNTSNGDKKESETRGGEETTNVLMSLDCAIKKI